MCFNTFASLLLEEIDAKSSIIKIVNMGLAVFVGKMFFFNHSVHFASHLIRFKEVCAHRFLNTISLE